MKKSILDLLECPEKYEQPFGAEKRALTAPSNDRMLVIGVKIRE